MKKTFFLTLLLISFGVFSQNRFGQIAVTGGPTYSLLRGIHRVPFRDFDNKFDFTVGGQLNLDWAFLRRLSLGAGFTYQVHRLNIYDYQYQQNGQIFTENPTQTIYVSGGYGRVLIHPLQFFYFFDEKFDAYLGGQMHMIFFQTENNSGDPDFHQVSVGVNQVPGVVGGIRYYPTPFFGLYAEAGIPGPYTFSLGIAFRSAGRDRFFGK